MKSIHQPADFVNAVVRTAEQDGVAVVIRDVFDISGDIGKIMVGKIRSDDSDSLLETDSQRRRGLVRGIVEALYHFHDGIGRLCIDPAPAVQRHRNQADRNVGLPRYILDCDLSHCCLSVWIHPIWSESVSGHCPKL